MADLATLEQRILSALARSGAGIDQLPKAAIDPSSPDPSFQSDANAEISAELVRLQRQVEESSFENQRLHSAIAQLREDLRLMEEQADAHLAQASRATQTLQAEFDALMTAREAETAEIAKILAALAPLVDAAEAHPNA